LWLRLAIALDHC